MKAANFHKHMTFAVFFLVASSLCLVLVACGGDTDTRAGQAGVVPFKELPIDRGQVRVTQALRSLTISLEDVPREVTLGETARYVVALKNTSPKDVSLEQCPAYGAWYGEGRTAVGEHYLLNCAAAPREIAAYETVRFEMKQQIDGEGITAGYSGSFHWRLLSAPADANLRASSAPITVTASMNPPPPSKLEPAAADPFATDGRTLGKGRFSFGPRGGTWAIFLEGPPAALSFRYEASLDSGERVCALSGSLNDYDITNSVRATNCSLGAYALTLGFGPSDLNHAEVALVAPGLGEVQREAQIGLPADESRIRPFTLVHASNEQFAGVRAVGANGRHLAS